MNKNSFFNVCVRVRYKNNIDRIVVITNSDGSKNYYKTQITHYSNGKRGKGEGIP